MTTKPERALRIVEGVEGVWFYHLAETDKPTSVALCGKRTMHTSVPLSAWGTKSHLNERWCSECGKEIGR